MSKVYKTKDLYEAALLYTTDVHFLDVERENGTCFFKFEDYDRAVELSDLFWSKRMMVNAKRYADAIKTMKELVFSK